MKKIRWSTILIHQLSRDNDQRIVTATTKWCSTMRVWSNWARGLTICPETCSPTEVAIINYQGIYQSISISSNHNNSIILADLITARFLKRISRMWTWCLPGTTSRAGKVDWLQPAALHKSLLKIAATTRSDSTQSVLIQTSSNNWGKAVTMDQSLTRTIIKKTTALRINVTYAVRPTNNFSRKFQ